MAERSYNGRDTLALLNGKFESYPSFTAATNTTSRWIDGTAGGSTTTDTYKWAINAIAGSGSSRFDTSQYRSGTSSLKVSTTATGSTIAVGQVRAQATASLVVQYGIKVRPNTTYNLSGWYKTLFGSGDATRGAYIRVEQFNAAGAALTSSDTTYIKTTTDWTNYTLSVTTRTNCYYVTVQCVVSGNLGTATLIMDAWFDDITLTEVLPARTPATSRTTATNRVAVRDMGTALRFDGVDDYVEVPDVNIPASTFTNGFTLSAWINPRSLGEASVANIFDKSTGTNGDAGFRYHMSAVNRLQLVVNTGTGRLSAVGSIILSSRWVHCLVSVESDGTVRHYINGVASGVVGTTGALSGITTTNALRIGNRSAATDRTFDGIIDEPRIWNRALTATEIKNLYLYGAVPQDGLVAEYLFDEASGTTAIDSSGNGNNGTITGATYTTDTPLRPRTSV